MMIPLLSAIRKTSHLGLPMERFYSYAGISRQGYFQALKRESQTISLISKLTPLISNYREKVDRRAGSRSLFYNLNIKKKFSIGVTKFESLLSENDLTLKPLRTRIVTTKSCLQSWNYHNLVNGLKIDNINQVVAGDLTYVSIGKNRFFLFTLIDLYSARIVGYHISDRQRAIDALKAAEMWVKLRKKKNVKGCIHHTDGGSQYFSEIYLSLLGDSGILSSRAGNCLKNGYAEQRHGTLKNHLFPTIELTNIKGGPLNIDKKIKEYNYKRKQEKLGWLSPVEYERKLEEQSKREVKQLHDFNQ